MGLAIAVGTLAELIDDDEEGASWFRDEMANVNSLLREHNLPEHVEPESLPQLNNRSLVDGFGYSSIHYLRRFAAHASARPGWQPAPFAESEDPTEDPVLNEQSELGKSHLLCHSDAEGYYVPIDFPEPLFDEKDRVTGGGMLGSSQGLKRELVALAPYLGIQLTDGNLSDAEADRINNIVEEDGLLSTEYMVWIALFEAARLSIEHKTAIQFT